MDTFSPPFDPQQAAPTIPTPPTVDSPSLSQVQPARIPSSNAWFVVLIVGIFLFILGAVGTFFLI